MFLDSIVNSAHASIFRYPEAINYLKSRGVSEEEICSYLIGYSKVISIPNDNHPDLKRFLNEMSKGKKFENRIIFPFQDAVGRVIGFTGRSIDIKDFKTFVTEEAKHTGFFFGLFQAIPYIYRENKVYVVEGCFDLLALRKVFPNTVAIMTSSMSEAQYEQLSFFCDRIIVCFDSDKAGTEGREKALQWNNVYSMDLGYKDPARCLEVLKLNKFKQYVLKKSKQGVLF